MDDRLPGVARSVGVHRGGGLLGLLPVRGRLRVDREPLVVVARRVCRVGPRRGPGADRRCPLEEVGPCVSPCR